MFPRLALLPIGLFFIWCFVCTKWYVCHIKQLCETEQPEPPPPVPEDTRPLVFKWDDASPLTRPSFDAYKESQLSGMGEGQLLEVTGHYYKEEVAPEGFANMGLARAAQIKARFIPPLTAEQIVENSKLVDPTPAGIQGDTLFEAVSFSIKTPAEPDKVECIVGNDNSLAVLFPFGKAEREVDAQIEECLQDVIALLKRTESNAMIVGHTDDSGSERFNQRLGRKRAKHIANILQKNGIPASRISTNSKGETAPIASNATEEGTRLNRRAVLTVVDP